MKQFFLFQREAPEGTQKRIVYYLWNALIPLSATVLIGLASLYYATGAFYRPMFISYLKNGWILLLNLLPVVWLALLVRLLSGRAWIGFLTAAAVTMGLTWVSFYKLHFRNDPMLFEDLFIAREAGAMAGNYRPFLTSGMVLVLLFVLAATAILLLGVRALPNRWVRFGGALFLLLLIFPARSLYTSAELYQQKTANNDLITIWSATDVYVSKGFIYPFLHSAADGDKPPEGYDAKYAARVLSAYEDDGIPADRAVSVIGIMLEAFQDFTKFGTPELAYDLYAPYHALEAEGVAGNLVTNIFAGGTVDTERAFLTGMGDFGSLRAPTNSYAWYFRNQGYTVEGMHPCFAWFYNRQNINESLGFEAYYFVENYFSPLTGGAVGMDSVFFPELMMLYESNLRTGKPYFNFSVTYQGHGPYNSDICWWGDKGDFVKEGSYTEEQQYILDNYFGSVADTVTHIAALADYLRGSSDPVVLVLFGDHNPWMGDMNSVYTAIGADLDRGTETGFLNYYATRYLIWANPAAREVLGGEWVAEGPDLSPCFLMNEVFRRCGWEGPAFMKVAAAAEARVPVLHATGAYFEGGRRVETLSPEGQAVVDDYLQAAYYYKKHFIY